MGCLALLLLLLDNGRWVSGGDIPGYHMSRDIAGARRGLSRLKWMEVADMEWGDNGVEEMTSIRNEPRIEGMAMSLRNEKDGEMGMMTI